MTRPNPFRRARRRGFTLIEIMVVIVIIGILAALIVPNVMGRTDEARVAAAHQDINALMQALKLYKLDNGAYPTQAQGLAALADKPTTPPLPPHWKEDGYIDKLPKDPWGNDYQYRNPGQHGTIDVYSLGPDGGSSGGGDSAEIGSWQ